MEIVTGYGGKAHITAEDWAELNRGIMGTDSYVFDVGRKFESELVSNNLLKIYDGCGLIQGRQFVIPAGQSDEITIENGTQGEKRIDLIVARYSKNEDTKIETVEIVLIKGASAETDPQVPEGTNGNIRAGDLTADMPLYEVELDGINVTEVRKVFKMCMTNADLSDSVRQLNANYIVEEGENDNGHYRKWSNGTLEMWGGYRGTFSISSGNVQGNIYYSANRTIPFPIESKTSARIVATVYSNGIQWLKISTSNTNKTGFDVVIMQSTGANPTANVNWSAIGTWK